MKKFLLSALTCFAAIAAIAQSPTTTTPITGCEVFRNFNTSDEGFSSPSIYSANDDVSFFWNPSLGAEIENSGLNGRTGSLISPVYTLSQSGTTTIGFRYEVPNATEYRIRIISAQASTAPLEILATTANGPIYTVIPNTAGNICIRLNDADLIAGQAVRFEFTFRVAQGNSNQRVLFDDLSLAVAGGALPVTFEGFVARKLDNGATKLLWNVGVETNVKGYYVETSTNGTNFKEYAYVTATGNKIYSTNYADKISGTMYFRIRNIDFDGKSKYSAIIKVLAKEVVLSSIEVYPQPAFEQVTIQHNKATENSVFTLYSTDGKVLLQKMAMPNTLQTQVNISNLKAGLYLLRYDDGAGKVQTKSLIKN